MMLKQHQLHAFGAPLVLTGAALPRISGKEVLVEVLASGVCHTDLHVCSGQYDLGNGRRLDASQRIRLPATPGHEIAGRVVALGPDADPDLLDLNVLVYPWIGCGNCPACQAGDDPDCPVPRFLGIDRPGGYASHVVLPASRYALPIGPRDPVEAASLACAGLTAWSAIGKCPPLRDRDALMVVGAGGVGGAVLQIARARFPDTPLLCADLSDDRRDFALASGATGFASGPDAIEAAARAYEGPVRAVIDCVGSGKTVAATLPVVAKGGHIIVVGLFGGSFDLSTLLLPTRNLTLRGSYVGTLDELRALLAFLEETGKVDLRPHCYEFGDANRALDDLRQGTVVGRAVLRVGSETGGGD